MLQGIAKVQRLVRSLTPRFPWDKRRIAKIGLTGGIGAGKSQIAARLRAAGIPVIDLDLLSKSFLQTDAAVREQIAHVAGISLEPWDDKAKRRLKARLFEDADVRRGIEAILHPKALEAFEREAQRVFESGGTLIVCEAALLVESGYEHALDQLVVVTAPRETRVARVMARDNLSEVLVRQILSAQVDEAVRLQRANRVIDNSSNTENLNRQVDWLIQEWKDRGWIRSARTERSSANQIAHE